MVSNLRLDRQKWERMTLILSREVADARTLVQIYLAVLKSVLLYVSETWILTPRMKRVLGGFYHRVSHRLTGRQPWKGRDVGFYYPLLEDAMVEAGLQEVETYVSRRQNTVAQYIITRPIMDLFLSSKRRLGPRVAIRW